MYCTKPNLIHLLPPTSDCLRQHVKRSAYQAAIWKCALKAKPEIPSPDGHGWKVSPTNLEIVWSTIPPAPQAILDFMKCTCKSNCSSQRYGCRKNNLKCTKACSCDNFCNYS